MNIPNPHNFDNNRNITESEISQKRIIKKPPLKKYSPAVIGLVLIILLIKYIGFEELFNHIKQTKITDLIPIVFLSLLSGVLSGARWFLAVRHLFLITTTWVLTIRLNLEMIALSYFVPGAQATGDIWRTFNLFRSSPATKSKWLECLYSVVWDRSVGLWSLFLISWVAMFFPSAQPTNTANFSEQIFSAIQIISGIVSIGFPIFVIFLPLIPKKLQDLRFLKPWLTLNILLRKHLRTTFTIIILSFLVLLLTGLMWTFSLRVIFPETPLAVGLATSVVIFVASSLPISMGGWGTREATAIAIMSAYGFSAGQAVSASIILGVANTIFALIITPLFLINRSNN